MGSHNNDQTVKKSTCHGCTRRCGLMITVKDGDPVSVKGDKSQPLSQGFVCVRGKAMALELTRDKQRLTKPLKRIGERGEGKWEEITWEQAITEIAEKLQNIVTESGPESVSVCVDCMITTALSICGPRFCKNLGTPNWFLIGGQSCYANSGWMEVLTYGQDSICDRANTKCTVVWGCNPANSKPEFFRYIKEGKKNGAKVIAVDPYYTETVKIADLWLRHRPGSSGALMLSWLNVIINENLFDQDFVGKWSNAPYLVQIEPRKILRQSDIKTDGDYDKFLAWDENKNAPVAFDRDTLQYEQPNAKTPLSGRFNVTLADGSVTKCTTVWDLLKERVADYSPEKIAEVSWVPAEKIREAARMFAANTPGNFFPGFAMDIIGLSSNQCGRARSVLNGILGNLDVKGGQVFSDGPSDQVRMDPGQLSPEVYDKCLGNDIFKVWSWKTSNKVFPYQKKSGAKFPNPFYGAHTPAVWRAMAHSEPYRVRAHINVGSNPMVSAANTELVEEALRSLDLLVVQDLYMTPTAELADYVTPAAIDEIERDKLYTGGYCSGWLETQSFLSGEKAVDAPGEAKSDFEFFSALGRALGQDWPWITDEEYYSWQLEPMGYASFKEFHEKVQWDVKQPVYERYLERGFGTPSGKVEIYSSILEDLDYDPLPDFYEPFHSPYRTPELYKDYPYIMGTMRPKFFYQSQYRSLPSLRKRFPEPQVHMNPETAKKHGLEEDDWVWLSSPTTEKRIKMRAKLVDTLDPRVIYPDYGWWFPELRAEDGNHGVYESNINVLTNDDYDASCPMIGGWFANANLLNMEKC